MVGRSPQRAGPGPGGGLGDGPAEVGREQRGDLRVADGVDEVLAAGQVGPPLGRIEGGAEDVGVEFAGDGEETQPSRLVLGRRVCTGEQHGEVPQWFRSGRGRDRAVAPPGVPAGEAQQRGNAVVAGTGGVFEQAVVEQFGDDGSVGRGAQGSTVEVLGEVGDDAATAQDLAPLGADPIEQDPLHRLALLQAVTELVERGARTVGHRCLVFSLNGPIHVTSWPGTRPPCSSRQRSMILPHLSALAPDRPWALP